MQASAYEWLKSHDAGDPWQPSIGVGELETLVDEGTRQLWPRTSVFWGAILDETDRRELATAYQAG